MTLPTCPYCKQPAKLVSGEAIYEHRPDLWPLSFWLCGPCKAWTGCHKGTDKPLGRLADTELRALKSRAHAAFDPLWKWGSFDRQGAYLWLSKKLNVPLEHCHIGMFDPEQCRKVIAISFEEQSKQRKRKAERA